MHFDQIKSMARRKW